MNIWQSESNNVNKKGNRIRTREVSEKLTGSEPCHLWWLNQKRKRQEPKTEQEDHRHNSLITLLSPTWFISFFFPSWITSNFLFFFLSIILVLIKKQTKKECSGICNNTRLSHFRSKFTSQDNFSNTIFYNITVINNTLFKGVE